MRRNKTDHERQLALAVAAAGSAFGCCEDVAVGDNHGETTLWRLTLVNFMPVLMATTILAGMAYILI